MIPALPTAVARVRPGTADVDTLLSQVCDAWWDPAAWRRNLLDGLCRLTHAAGGVYEETAAYEPNGTDLPPLVRVVRGPCEATHVRLAPDWTDVRRAPYVARRLRVALQARPGCNLTHTASASRMTVCLSVLVGRRLAVEGQCCAAGLPRRLRQTLDCLLRGASEKQVCAALGLSGPTVHQYVGMLYRHFEVHTRAELMAYFVARRPKPRGPAV